MLINNYVDLDPSSPDVADFRGRTGARARTYDGHQGIDIDIPSFREMDDGRAVIHAVTAGVVEQVIEDQPDRNITCAGRWNVVRVRHANGFAVLYGHIQRGSARVRPGQPIAPGTPLAIVGSAGCSTQPHLHLEVRDCAGRAVETLRQPGVWRNPPLDEPGPAVMDVMLVDGDVPSVAQVKDPARDPTVIEPDGTLGVGLSLAARGGDRRSPPHWSRPTALLRLSTCCSTTTARAATATGTRGSRWQSAQAPGAGQSRSASTGRSPPRAPSPWRHRASRPRSNAAVPRSIRERVRHRRIEQRETVAGQVRRRRLANREAHPARRRRQPRHRSARRVTEQHRVRGVVRHGRGDDGTRRRPRPAELGRRGADLTLPPRPPASDGAPSAIVTMVWLNVEP